MNSPATVVAPVSPTAEQLRPISDLYGRGLFLQAQPLADAIGPLVAWRGTAARILAGRLAAHLGAPRLSSWHFLRAYREEPDSVAARYCLLRHLQTRYGPLEAWTRLQRFGLPENAPPETLSQWLVLQADLLNQLRDFDGAEAALNRADQLTPRAPAVLLQRSELLTRQDRQNEALAVARESLEVQPWYRPGVLAVADLLIYLERDDEAVALLREATTHLESGSLWTRLAAVQIEQERFAEGIESLDGYARHAPLMEPAMAAWLAGRRADCAYGLGDIPQTISWARQAKGAFWEELTARLEQAAPDAPFVRRILPVAFIWQHHQTCAPAVLASLCRFWSMPGDHLDVAEEIAYDGTPSHSQRRWAEDNGWCAREFTVTWDNARALIDRGIPFALATASPAAAHLQAVVGYDDRRGTLFLRDPSQRLLVEVLADGFLESYRSLGPRGMVLVPRAKEAEFNGLELLDSGLYDHLHQMYVALEAHDRPAAVRSLEAIQTQAPGHRLALQARRRLAGYDGNSAEQLDTITKLLELFPDDPILLVAQVDCLRDLARRDERLAVVRKLCDRPSPDSVCLQMYARELSPDGREHVRARRLLRRAIRRNSYHAEHYLYLANLYWGQRRFDDSFALYRFAACLDDKGESYARAYFRAARCLGRAEEGVSFLRQRFARFGRKSSLPARTLARCLAEMERVSEALDVLEEARQLRPEDGALLLHAADLCIDRGRFERAAELLEAAQGKAHAASWLRSAARLAGGRGEVDKARQLWEQVLADDPLAIDAHRNLAQLLAGTQGRQTGVEHLCAASARYPHYFDLAKVCNEWLRDDDPAGAETVIRRLLQSHPVNGWARRELAVHLAKLGRFDEALAELTEAERLEPLSSSLFSVRGFVMERAGRVDDAKANYRRAIELDVDSDTCIRGWLRLCDDLAARREVLALVETELARQVTFGDGLFAFQQAANRTFEPEEVLATLRRILDARPDLWQVWSALIDQLAHLGRADEALTVAKEAVQRFPLAATLWTDQTRACSMRHDNEGEIAALRQALEISPSNGRTRRLLAEAYERLGRFDEARAVLEGAVLLAPLVAANHSALADVLWKMGQRRQTLERQEQALLLDPLDERRWDRLCDWARDLSEPQRAVELAQRLTTARPMDARLWLALGRTLARDSARHDEALAAFDRALTLDPRLADAHDRKAELLCRAKRLDEARAACTAAIWDGKPPQMLRIRAAIIDAEAGDYDRAKAAMREVLRDDPNSYRAWAFLADWSETTKNWPEYLEASENMVRLAPHSSTPYGYRGSARLANGNRAGAKEDWRQALHLAPDYAWAAFRLFDAHLDDGEFREAARTLRRVRRYRRNEYTQARLCQLFARRGKRNPALRALRRLVVSNHSPTWPLEGAEEACVRAGLFPQVERILVESFADPRCRPQAAVVWANRIEKGPRWEAALAVLPRALELIDQEIAARPTVFRSHDVKAMLLAFAGRFDEAEAACKHRAQTESISLRGRLVWVHDQAGNTARAVEVMTAAVKESPNYDWGWRRFAEWTEKLHDWPRHLEATENMVRLDPNTAMCYGYRGEARSQTGNRAGAKEDFRKATELDPKYGFGFSRLFDMQLEDGELRDAARTLRQLRRYQRNEYGQSRLCQLFARRRKRGPALRGLRRLVLSGHSASWPLESAESACFRAGWGADVAGLLTALLPDPRCRPQAGVVWANRIEKGPRFEAAQPLLPRVLELIDQEIAARPSGFRAHDCKAMMLAFARRFPEAEAACQHPAQADSLSLRGRLAWVYDQGSNTERAIETMAAVLREWPDYDWGWWRLAEWTEKVKDWPAHLKATENMVRLNPRSAMSYGFRGEARFQTRNRAGAKEDFRKAIEIDPQYGFGLSRLFDLSLEDGELDEAEHCAEALRRKNDDAFSWRRFGRLAAARGNKEDALANVRKLALSAHASAWPLDDLHGACENRGWRDDLVELYEGLLPQPGCRPQVAMLWTFEIDADTAGDAPVLVNAAVTLLDRAIAERPTEFKPHDSKATLLTLAARFEEAEAACKHPAQAQSYTLRGRLAWVHDKAGNTAGAVEEMAVLLREHPDYDWGWRRQVEWTEKLKNWPRHLEASENMVRLNPRYSVAYGYRGEARWQTGNRAGAKEDFRKSVQLDPKYSFGLSRLFDLCLDDRELEECERCAEALRRKSDDAHSWRRFGRLAVARRNKEEALANVRKLVLSAHTSPWPLDDLHTGCLNTGWRDDLVELYEGLLPQENCRPQVATLWTYEIDAPAAQDSPDLVAAVLRLLDRTITEKPREFQPHDAKATLLALAGRYAEAEAACQHPAQQQSFGLRGRRAWVHDKAGNTARAVEEMAAVLRDSPNYDWGWRRQVEWTEKLSDWPRHLEATENMVRLNPRLAMSYGYRGEARFQTGNRAGAKEDFRKASELDPKYGFGWSRLFELCLEDGELDESDLCFDVLRRKSDDAFTWRRAGRLAIARQQKDQTLDRVRQIGLSNHPSPWPLDDLTEACLKAGWRKDLIELYAELLPEENCRPQIAMLWVDEVDRATVREHPELAARANTLLDQAIAERPRDFKAYDVKALLLCQEGRFDDAEDICRKPPIANLISVRGRLAWVMHLRGRYTPAITVMKECLQESPNYGWGFAHLIEWASELEAGTLRRWAGENYIRINPSRPAGFRHRGQGRLRMGDKTGAKEDFRQGLTLDPKHTITALHLFDVLLELGELDEAQRVLGESLMKTYPPYRLGAEVRLAVRRGQKAEALDKLKELCAEGEADDRWLLDELVMKLFEAAGWQDDAEETLQQALDGEKVGIFTGEHWLKLRTARGLWLTAEEVDNWAERGPAGVSVLLGHALALGRAGRGSEISEMLELHDYLLREETYSWGRICRALMWAGEFAAATEWMHDWESRRGLKPAILLDLALAFRGQDRDPEARRIHGIAQTLNEDSSTGMHELWLGLDAALTGETETARQCLEILEGAKLEEEPVGVWLRALVQAVVDGDETTTRTDSFDELRRGLDQPALMKEGIGMRQVLTRVLQLGIMSRVTA